MNYEKPEQEQPQQQQPPPSPVSGLRTLCLPSPSPPSPPSPPVSGPPLPPPDPSPAIFPPPLPPLPPPLSHTWLSCRSPRARPSSPVPFTNLRTALFCSSPPCLSPSVLPSPLESALTASLSTPVTNYYHKYRPVLSRVLASLVTDPRASLSSVSALTAAVTEFASTRCLDYATSLVAAPSTSPLAVGGECALGCDALEDRQFELEFLAAASPHLCAMQLAPKGDPDTLDIPTPRTYAEAVLGPWASQVKRPPGSPPVFKVHFVARGFSQREGVDFFQTFAPTPNMTTLLVLLHPSSANPSLFVRRGSTPFFVLVYVDDLVFATADRVALANVKPELQKRHTCTNLGELSHYLGLQITRDRAARTITLSQSHMVPQPSGPYAELVGCLMYLMTCTRPDLAFPLSILASFAAPWRHRPIHWTAAVRVAKYLATTSGVGLILGGRQDVVLTGHTVLWRSIRSSLVWTSTAEIYAGAMGAQELRWLTFLLTGLSERPSSALTLFTDNKAMILPCREPRVESRMKHINVKYFLLRELQRRGQAHFDFVESDANTADIFTKALPPCDHQRCCVQLAQHGMRASKARSTTKTPTAAQGMTTQKERSSSNGSPGTTPTPPPTSGLQTAEGTATRPAAESTETPANKKTGLDPSMMEKFFSFMSFYEQHQHLHNQTTATTTMGLLQ
ncbi:unnamed protein product [Closterium sp. NIES-53]